MEENLKSEILGRAKEIDKQLEEQLQKLNTYDAVITLLSFLEILDSEGSYAARQLFFENDISDQGAFMGFMDTYQTTLDIYEVIRYLLENNNGKQELSAIPSFSTRSTDREIEHPEVVSWFQKLFNKETDHFETITIQSGVDFLSYRYVIFHKFYEITPNEQILRAYFFLRLYLEKKHLKTMLRSNPSLVEMNEEGILHTKHNIQDVLSKYQNRERLLTSGIPSFPMYKQGVEEKATTGLKSTRLPAGVPAQQIAHNEEHNSYFDEFLGIPSFKSEFKKSIGVSVEDFRDVTLALKNLALVRSMHVIDIPKQNLIKKLKQETGISKQIIQKIVDYLTKKENNRFPNKGIIQNGNNYIFSWCSIGSTRRYPLTKIYYNYIDANIIGIEFEKECRSLFHNMDWNVFDDRIIVNEQMLPSDVSEELWGWVKSKTDLDVVADNKKFLVVIECKSELPKLKKKESQTNTFKKYAFELDHKAIWISNNFLKFQKIAKEHGYEIPNTIEYVISFLVTSYILPKKELISFTISEMKEVIQKIRFDDSGKKLLISIPSGDEIEIDYHLISK